MLLFWVHTYFRTPKDRKEEEKGDMQLATN